LPLEATVRRDGEHLWSTGERRDDPQPVGAIGETFVVAGALALCAEGRLALDVPVAAWLGEHPLLEDVTLRSLVAHCSGLEPTQPDTARHTVRAASRAEALAQLERAERTAAPGARFAPCSLNYDLAAAVVASAAGVALPDYLRDELFGPLGMTRTEWPSRLGPSSTVDDLAAWCTFLTGREEPRDVHVIVDPRHWSEGRGLGLDLRRSGDRVVAVAGGAEIAIAMDAATRTIAVVACPDSAALRAAELVEQGAQLRSRRPWVEQPPAPPEIRPLLGRWWSEGEPVDIRWRDGCLQARRSDRADEGWSRFEREPA
jgi:hypothetical protein